MIYNIAGVLVDMEPKYPRTAKQSEAYIVAESGKSNIRIRLSDEFLSERQKENPHLTLEDCEYIWLGSEFYNALPAFGGMLLHSSAVVHEDKGYLFSAPSGTGKSTHTQLWLKEFDGSYILNDDKPAIMLTDKGIYVYGTPFSGKTDWNVNKGVPLQGICALERGAENIIERMSPEEATFRILNQTVRPYEEERMQQMLDVLDRVISEIPTYMLHCNMDPEAARVSYTAMRKGKVK